MEEKFYYVRPFGFLGGRYKIDAAGRRLQNANWVFSMTSGLAFALAVSENLLSGLLGAFVSVIYVLATLAICLKLSIMVMESGVLEKS